MGVRVTEASDVCAHLLALTASPVFAPGQQPPGGAAEGPQGTQQPPAPKTRSHSTDIFSELQLVDLGDLSSAQLAGAAPCSPGQ